MMTLSLALSVILGFSSTILAQSSSRQIEYQTIALTGQRALGPAVDAYFESLHGEQIGDGGHVVFRGGMAGQDITEETRIGLWAGRPGEISNVIWEGHDFPPLADVNYISVNRFGELAVDTAVSPSRNDVIWTGTGKPLLDSIQESARAPGTEEGVVWSDYSPANQAKSFQWVQLDSNSHLSFTGYLAGPGLPPGQQGIWAGPSNNLRLVVRTDTRPPGLPDGAMFHSFWNLHSSNGTLAFLGFAKGPGINSSTAFGIWSGRPDDVQLIVSRNDAATGIAEAHFTEFDRPEVDGSGRVVFDGWIAGPQIDASNDRGVWVGDENGVELLFREGDPIPAIPGAYIGELRVEPAPMGRYTMVARLIGDKISTNSDTALLFGTRDDMRLIAREGSPVPGAGPNLFFGEVHISSVGIPATSSGILAFHSELRGSGADANDDAYYLADSDGTVFLVARDGGMFDIGGGNSKQLASLGLFDGPREGTLNDNGQLVFRVGFADNSFGIFTAQIVPEPSAITSLVMAAVGSLAILRQRMSRPQTAGAS